MEKYFPFFVYKTIEAFSYSDFVGILMFSFLNKFYVEMVMDLKFHYQFGIFFVFFVFNYYKFSMKISFIKCIIDAGFVNKAILICIY